MPVIPSSNLDPNAAPWGRWVTEHIQSLEQDADRAAKAEDNINKQQNSTALAMQQRIGEISSIVDTLTAISKVQYAESTDLATNFSGFFNGTRPTVNVTSPTGRVEINFGGSLNGGSGYFCYSIFNNKTNSTVVSRDSVQANPAQRVAVTGGASFSPSGYKSTVLTVPNDAPLTIRLEMFASDAFVAFLGGSILARVAP